MDNIKQTIDLDKILHHVGPFGLWQLCHLFILFSASLTSGMAVVTFAFTGFVPKFRCLIPQCESMANASFHTQNSEYVDLNFKLIGVDKLGKSCQRVSVHGQALNCQEYVQALLQDNGSTLEIGTCPPEQIIYDASIVQTSVTEDYGLICDRAIVRSVFNSLYLLGMLLGSFVIGIISDKFGRRKALTISIGLLGLSGLLIVWIKNEIIFACLRIISGIGGMGIFMISSVLAAEGTLPDSKIVTMLMVGLGFVSGELLLTLEAFFIRHWVTLQLVSHAPILLLLVVYFILPESSRWLISKGNFTQVKKDLAFRARLNRKPDIPKELFEIKELNSEESLTKMVESYDLKDLFKDKVMLFRSLNMFFQWFSVTMSYYGLLFASTSLSGDPYLNFALVTSVELLNVAFYVKLPDLLGRKMVLVLAQLINGVCCIVAGLLTTQDNLTGLQIGLVMTGRMFASLGFGLCYIYTAELYPTQLRSTTVGICSTVARFGGIIALLMQGGLSHYWPPLILIIFGTIASIAGFLALKFPETKGQQLPESIKEAKNLGNLAIRRNRFGFILSSSSD